MEEQLRAQQEALTEALNAFTLAINNMNTGPDAAAIGAAVAAAIPAAAAPPAPGNVTASSPAYNFHKHSSAYDLTQRFGQTAYNLACQPISDPWDGTPSKFPSFLVDIKDVFSEQHWNTFDGNGLVFINYTPPPVGGIAQAPVNHNILSDYGNISDADVAAAFAARTSDRAKQNAAAFFKTLKGSITGDLKVAIFETDGNSPTNEDGVDLWVKLTNTTTLSSLQLMIQATSDMLTYDPSSVDFVIPTVNRDMKNCFTLATTPQRKILDMEQIQHMLAVYLKIKQPPEWWTWVQHQQDDYRKGKITSCKDFLNQAVIKYNEIKGDDTENKFRGSLHTEKEEIVAMSVKLDAKVAAASAAAKRRHVDTNSDPRTFSP